MIISVLSVDLGTSNTVAVLSAHGRPPRVVEVDGSANMPSAVFAAEDGRLVVGREAERNARLAPARFEPNPKRRIDEGTLLLGDRVVSVTEAFAAVLGKVVGEVSRQLGGGRPDEVRLTHPAQWGPVRRNVLLSAARQAGLGTNLVLVPEPVAAAAHFASFPARSLTPGQALAVYDLGAGTFDVAAVGATQNGFTVLAEAGLPDLGGLDIDQALLAHVGRQVSARDPQGWQRLMVPQSTADRRTQRALREDVRAAKEALSGHPQTEVPLPEQFGDVLVTRTELENLVRPNLVRSVALLADTVEAAGLSSDRLAGVYLVGGSSRMPLVATLIAERLRIVATNLDQPETAVALGAHHVSAEGAGLRTDRLPDPPEERTTHIAPPPRPTGRPVQQPPPPQPVVPVPQAAPLRPQVPAWAPAPAAAPRRGMRRWWWVLVPGVVVLVVAVWTGVKLISNSATGPQGPAVAISVRLPAEVDCEQVIPMNEINDAVSSEAEIVTEDYTSGDDGGYKELCWWAPTKIDGHTFEVRLSNEPWLPPTQGEIQSGKGEKYSLKGNDAYQSTEFGDMCEHSVAVGADRELSVSVDYIDDRCTAARGLLEVAFSNLSKS